MIIFTDVDQYLNSWPEEYKEIEIELGEASKLLVFPRGENRATIVRLISSNPNDYLRPEYQPGTEIEMMMMIKQ
ncbi:MAG: YlzJ-like family protein [Chitinophagales bacterium]